MLKGPRGQRQPADVVGTAITVAKIATGEIEEIPQKPSGKVKSGRAGGKARKRVLTPEERKAVAKKAAVARWG